MTEHETIVLLNIEHLQQGQRMIADLSDEMYVASDPGIYNSGIGDHLRHILEHYQLFLQGYAESFVDYDARLRDKRISSDREFASLTIDAIVKNLGRVTDMDKSLKVKMATSPNDDRNAPFSESTVKRELQYLQAHTIHHFALIAMILRLLGQSPSEDFGVAPSTLHHLQTQPA